MGDYSKSQKNRQNQQKFRWLFGRGVNRRKQRQTARLTEPHRFQGLEALEIRQLMSSAIFGDFDGDGFQDLIVGVPREDIGTRVDAGAINVLYGAAKGLVSSGNQGFNQDSSGIAGGSEDGDLFGAAISVGDFNGDNFDDVAIGAPGEDIGLIVNAGAVNVIYGSPAGLTSVGNEMWEQNSVGIRGAAEANDRFGSALASGDFDGDGFTDLAIGVPGESIGLIQDAGAVNVLYGSLTGLTGVGDDLWSQNSFNINGASEQGDNFGLALAAGDFNNDGNDDLGIGVPREDIGLIEDAGAVNVIYGSFTGLRSSGNQFWTQDSTNIFGLSEVGDRFGSALASGDFDNDGKDDLAIGSPGEDVGTILNAGAVNIIYGTIAGGLNSAGNQIWDQDSPGILGGSERGDQFGWVLGTGDFDGNGGDDLAIGAPGEDIGTIRNAGAVNVIYCGGRTGLTSTGNEMWHQDSRGIRGRAETNDSFGAALAVGDFDGDGKDDMAAGVPGEDIRSTVDAGAVSVIYGSKTGLSGIGDDLWHQGSTGGIAGIVETGDNFGAGLDAGGIYPLYSEFDIEVRFTDGSLTASQQSIFTTAAARWSQIIISDIPDIVVAGFGWVDDVVIDAWAPAIDGVGNFLAFAGPTFLRPGSFLPARGRMRFDSADIANLEAGGQLYDTIVHEMGHVLGFGTIWGNLGLLQNPVQFNAAGVALPGPNNPQFTGANATNEFNAATGGAAVSVPVENNFGLGTANSHWRQAIFPNDLMNGFIGANNILSRMTTASMADLGYVVDILASDGA